jgi:uncharacterized protein
MQPYIRRGVQFVLILMLGLCVFVVFSHLRPIFNDAADLICRIFLLAALLVCSLLTRKSERFRQYWQIFFAFFIAALAITVDFYLPSREWLLALFNIPIQTTIGIAIEKIDSCIIISGMIILLTKISGASLTSIYLNKNKLKQSFLIGIIAFFITASGAIFIANIYGAENLTIARILPWTPWILIFIFGNAFNEELLFRGLFLQKIEPLLGKFLSNLVVAIPFVLHHTGVTYTNDAIMFLIYLLPLALAWGYIMQKTGSIWGSFLFHAGTDIPVVLVIFSQLP